ncbi:plexin-A2-like isoform X2 [Gigantopelta aegis]|uniref:plexin-A2-like isoform X2 n=1 Tax=Gigantopelta aegis TaxID=1735272 RepID=UPI001B88E319|nr:plexin-A2-like isoform X2 [Gigantopelta aegis]
MTPWDHFLVCVALLTTCHILIAATSVRYVVSEFPGKGQDPIQLNHLTVNTETRDLYVGAVNHIFHLTDNFTVLETAETGPRNDNPNCPPVTQLGKCSYPQTPTDSHNKALMIDYTNRRLIVCSTLFHGHCEKRYLDNITATDNVANYEPCVANNAQASTVAFIAHGPKEENLQQQPMVLYIAATYTTTGLPIYREKVPAFCSRSLDSFRLVKKAFRSTKIEIELQQRDTFPVHYVYGFASGKFSYVVSVQRQNVQQQNYISKLLRVCQNDPRFYSYVEVELKCNIKNVTYNLVQAAYMGKAGSSLAASLGVDTTEDVLYAVFSLGKPNSPEPLSESVLCVYPRRVIVRTFTGNIQSCFKGVGNTGPDHIVVPQPCIQADFHIDDDYCGAQDINNPLNGYNPIKEEAVLKFTPNTTVSSIIVSITHFYTVAFVGTTSGHIKKVAVEGKAEAATYEDVTVQEGHTIFSDLRLDDSKKHLYVMTTNKLTKLKVYDCSQYITCGECLGARDPYCGWCTLENKCSSREECESHDTPMRWLPYKGQQCTNITKVLPDNLQKDHHGKTRLLIVEIENLPQFQGNYECAFSYNSHYSSIITRAQRRKKGVECFTPLPNQLPPFPTGQDHITMRLSVRMNDQDFVSTDFIFFDCSLHNSCTSCTESLFPCSWCIRSHLCTHLPNEDCPVNETLVTGKNLPGTSMRIGPKACPQIEFYDQKIQTLVPANTRKAINIKASNLKLFQIKTPLKCFFNMNAGITVPATIQKIDETVSNIACEEVMFDYFRNVSSQNVPFQVLWGNMHPLDNPSNIQVMMYKCTAMASTCGQCLGQHLSDYSCGWCENQCSTQGFCEHLNKYWLPNQMTCPNPVISEFYPQSGPKEGGTLLTIVGENLGKEKNEISVDIDGTPCTIVHYKAPTSIQCKTGQAKYHNQKGYVQVIVTRKYVAKSKQMFKYVIPSIKDIQPNRGPFDGGTRVTIIGNHMDAGTKKNVSIGNLECKFVESLNRHEVVCETMESPSQKMSIFAVRMIMDNQVIQAPTNVYYTYVDNPVVSRVVPKRGIRSGGLSIVVTGTNFDHVQKPQMLLLFGNQAFESDCKLRNSHKMVCRSPPVFTLRSKFKGAIDVPYGFRMDNVKDVYNLTQFDETKFGVFTIFPDPEFKEFKGKTKAHQKKTEFLTIDGHNLNPPLRTSDVVVLIGQEFCNVTSVAENQLTCRPPKSQPAALEGTGPPEVVVRIGKNLTYSIGYLLYEEPETLTLAAIVGIAAGAAVLVLIVIIVIIAYQVKSRRSNDMMKKMRIQMDSLEARVANECKEAFAELQTDMTELTSDLYGQVSIPFWDYRTYCMNVLFPGVEHHSVIRDLQIDPNHHKQEDVERGLSLFFQLMSNKTFLLIFIRTLESSKNFQLRDRVNVASLITVALQTKMEYSTDILKTLLSDLIEKTVEDKNQPKLLLRRNESVAEKMLTNWFSFLLYKFLKECAGEPLFMLYQAVKQQVSKGPVDAVTSEARYSLGEDKLIRQQINYKPMSLNVVDMDSFTQQHQTHTVKVLDCDSICQVKEKILDAMYKNAPFSSRPAKAELDLVLFETPPAEWICTEKSRQLILHDEDNSSKMEGDCKRLNTLNHYQVPDGAFVAIVPKQDSHYNTSSLSIISEKSNNNFSITNRSSPVIRLTSPDRIHIDLESNGTTKFYHLVRQHDADIQKEGDRGSKMVTEIYLPRLLVTKGTLQQFVDDLFERIFSTAHRGTALPLAIKYMFDFLDDQALLHNIMDPEVVHTWKSNSLPLRFWVNVIKNPNFVFDIYKSNIVDSCLTVIGQTFMDACSVSEHRLGKHSPSSKLLYAKDIPKYKKWVERYYQDIKMMPAISDQDMTAMLTDESRLHGNEFNINAALLELYKYVQKYNEELVTALEEDEFARKSRLSYKLDQVQAAMDGDAIC